MSNNGNGFDQSVKKIRRVFCEYSAEDVAFSLLVSDLWLPNIASPIKHQLLYGVFISTDSDKFSKKNRIFAYKDFRELLERVYSLLPSIPWIEDYVPEPDWGEVKFHHKGEDFKIFYGIEIGNIYDHLTLFQILYGSRNDDFVELESRSPDQEFRSSLSLQDVIISGIVTQPTANGLTISPGGLEIPPRDFWKQSLEFFQKFDPLKVVPNSFAKRLSCKLGSLPKEVLKKRALMP